MRKHGFYARLAAQNMKKNGKYYLPYLLTCSGAAAMFYTMFFLSENQGINALQGSGYVLTMLWLGSGIIGIFSAIVLFYTNSFLMKQRKKELGLYNILGMEKRHIARFLFWETAYTAFVGILGGLALGILLSKLMLLILCAILRAGVPFGFFVSGQGVWWTAVVFCAIFLLSLLTNLGRIGKSQPIELLRGGNAGDREPKTRWLAAVAGTVTLIAGYVIALMVKTPLAALGLFFVAVLLVIIGTYCLFMAGSIAVLKLLRRNKAYYYQTKHFTAVSGMLHRMKRNAAGLASVCILSTMVLVTVSTTVCLYLGMEEVLDMLYPRDVHLLMVESDQESMYAMVTAVEEEADRLGIEISELAWACYYPGENDLGNTQFIGDKLKAYQDGLVLSAEGQAYPPTAYVGFNVAGGKAPAELREALSGLLNSGAFRFQYGYVDERDKMAGETYAMLGGFFFIGLLLGFLFLMATALIIYYKQVSEGYEDAEGFRIMQQVGMNEQEVRGSIHSQVMMVFFLPLFAAGVHIAFAFNMITRLLTIFSLNNVGLFALCCLGTFLVFAAIYAAIYGWTAKAYYQIVKA